MLGRGNRQPSPARFHCGDIVTVRDLSEIVATLDADGALEGLPFMPEMAKCCKRSFRVYRRAERTCVEGADGPRRMENTVFLEGLRCDGTAHDGCQRGCLFFWKEAWLRPAAKEGATSTGSPAAAATDLPTRRDSRYYCQSTELAKATMDLAPGNVRYYLRDLWAGETTVRRVVHMVWLAFLGFVWRRVFGEEFYRRPTGPQKKTTVVALGLQPGELVEVRSVKEIQATLDAYGRNRGLSFEREMLACCGRRYRVLRPLEKMISEISGRMITVRNTVILEGAACRGICVQNCPRANHFFWREAWLKRVPDGTRDHDGLPDSAAQSPACDANLVLPVVHGDVDPLAAKPQAHNLQA